MNVVDYLLDNPAGADQVFLYGLQGCHTYGEVASGTDRVARFLARRGVRKGDRVVVVGENSLFWVTSYLGIIKAGCVAVPIAPNVPPAELRHIVHSTEAATGFLERRLGKAYLPVFEKGSLVVLDGEGEVPEASQTFVIGIAEALAEAGGEESPSAEVEDRQCLAALMFTSGSTGRPRGAMVTHRNIIANTDSIIRYLELTAADRIMAVLPFYYCFGTSLLHTHLRVGGSIVLDPRFMFPDKVLVRMQQTRCTGFAGVPSHYQMLLRNSHLKEMKFPNLRYVQQAGGRLSSGSIQELREALPNVRVFVMYGQTEATARLSYLSPELLDKKLGSIGKGIPGVTLRVLDEGGRPVAPGQVGEIVATGENIAMGYWRDIEETSSIFREGTLYTGDMATVDEDGYIYIVDRAKDILKCGGQRVGCKQVEDILLEFDRLVEVAVVGVPDDLLGEAVKAFVVARNCHKKEIRESLLRFCESRLPPHLAPKEIVVLDALPKNSAGKVMKAALKTMKVPAE